MTGRKFSLSWKSYWLFLCIKLNTSYNSKYEHRGQKYSYMVANVFVVPHMCHVI